MKDVTRRARLAGCGGLAGLLVVAGLAAAPAALAKAKNVDFVGTWTPNTGVAWTVTRENRASGTCRGYSALKSEGYGFVDCRVSGDHYRFVVTYGSGYRSVNTGTIHGNRLTGRFDDGSINPYTARRTKH